MAQGRLTSGTARRSDPKSARKLLVRGVHSKVGMRARPALVLAWLLPLAAAACAVPTGEEVSSSEAPIAATCAFDKGALPRSTLKNVPAHIPIKHVIVVMQENRSFDHMLGSLAFTRGDVDGIPADFVNRDAKGEVVHFQHRTDTCFEADSPHNEEAMESAVDGDKISKITLG